MSRERYTASRKAIPRTDVSEPRHWRDGVLMREGGMLATIRLLTRHAVLLDFVVTSSPLDMPKGLGRGYFFPTVHRAEASWAYDEACCGFHRWPNPDLRSLLGQQVGDEDAGGVPGSFNRSRLPPRSRSVRPGWRGTPPAPGCWLAGWRGRTPCAPRRRVRGTGCP